MEAIGDVHWHLGSSQLFKGLGIQGKQECAFVLMRNKVIFTVRLCILFQFLFVCLYI